ncbi:hypothetical protein Ptr902_13344 [Pyrenophora tritici-repentis]|nr:hypothetical protein Ptr902_13507 [Pyrenophora tritici-repentis]KAI2475247.1 hypothetical protein Ptr902_13344 [Pyrenophora tritici-repentis]
MQLILLSTPLLIAPALANYSWACASSKDVPTWNKYCDGGSHVNCIYPETSDFGKLNCRGNFPWVVLWKNDLKLPGNTGAIDWVNGEKCVYACIWPEG